jgi:predicted short-subunit dehydrogenase-like oxidoreductase (DUF2520 family)
MQKRTVAIIGAGRVGGSVGYLLNKAGYVVETVLTRSMDSAWRAAAFIGAGDPKTDLAAAGSSEIIFITTPDRVIRAVCEKLAATGAIMPGSLVIHMSGAHSLGLLDAARAAGAYGAVLHPLQSLASREQGVQTLPGSYFRVEADPEALERARLVVASMGGIELAMPDWKSDADSAALYHAGAVAVSNYFVALVDYGLKFYQALGANKQEALKAVLPLIRGTLHNIETLGIPDALTGPIVRGDIETVRDHLAAIRKRAPGLLALYRELAKHTITVAKDRRSLTQESIFELTQVIEQAGRQPGQRKPKRKKKHAVNENR